MSILIEFFKFIYRPSIHKSSSHSIYKKIYDVLSIYFFCFIIGISISIITFYFINTPKRKDNDINLGFDFIFLSCLFLPLVEEILFRLSLIYSRCNFSFTLGGLSFLFLNNMLKANVSLTIENSSFIRIVVSIIISIIIGTIFYSFSKKYNNILNQFHRNNFKVLFYLSSIIFALLHISNFEMNLYSFLISPLMTLPQLLFGLAAGFIRVKYGFLYCFFIHILSNVIPTVIIIYFFK